MNQIPQAGEIYQHFKGKLYRIVALATHTETGEQLVIYQALYGEFQVFARPLSMFLEKVDAKKYPDAAGKDRFMRIPMAEAAAVPQPVPAPSENPVEPRPAAMPSESNVESRAVAASSENSVEPQPDPGLLAFLDADSYEEKLEVMLIVPVQSGLTVPVFSVLQYFLGFVVSIQFSVFFFFAHRRRLHS